MATYLDHLAPHNGTLWAHLIADTEDELHAMARKCGLKRSWFQASPPASFPHYDCQQRIYYKLIRAGAIRCDRKVFIKHLQRIRATRQAEGFEKLKLERQKKKSSPVFGVTPKSAEVMVATVMVNGVPVKVFDVSFEDVMKADPHLDAAFESRTVEVSGTIRVPNLEPSKPFKIRFADEGDE